MAEKEKKNSAARIQANNRYNAKAYDRINIAIPKGRKADIEERAKLYGYTVNSWLNMIIQIQFHMSDEEWRKGSASTDSPGDKA